VTARKYNKNNEIILELIRNYYNYRELIYSCESFDNIVCAFLDFEKSCNTVLTEREKEIVECVKTMGESSTSILKGISNATVKYHILKATRKICIDLEGKSA
jgi:predicted DNA binding protein